MSLHKDHITIYDIARRAGVSAATVSRVLNKHFNVSTETRERVEKIIQEQHYEPNEIARTLHNRLSRTIGLLVQSLNNPFFVKICNEAEEYCDNIGYTLLIGITSNDFQKESKLLNTFLKKQVDGFILLGGRANEFHPDKEMIAEMDLMSKHVPIVFINGGVGFKNCFVVNTDEAMAFDSIMKYLFSCGHKKIGLITGQRNLWTTDEKVRIYKENLKKNRYGLQEDWIVSGEYTIESGEQCMNKILSRKKLPTAVACTNDILAIGAMRAVLHKGLKIPEDVSITGFDDIFMAAEFIPPLTTIRQNYSLLAAHAVRTIIDYIEGKEIEKKIIIKAELIVRDSCASPRN
ncbi:MAG: LacI family DNA-binding transcriptional regulator [Spirochaetales bacterium]|nr:LacI family DNA-binding transcriptional regulator [Spirochaetales bacterium]